MQLHFAVCVGSVAFFKAASKLPPLLLLLLLLLLYYITAFRLPLQLLCRELGVGVREHLIDSPVIVWGASDMEGGRSICMRKLAFRFRMGKQRPIRFSVYFRLSKPVQTSGGACTPCLF